jgi:hypothetical protein
VAPAALRSRASGPENYRCSATLDDALEPGDVLVADRLFANFWGSTADL